MTYVPGKLQVILSYDRVSKQISFPGCQNPDVAKCTFLSTTEWLIYDGVVHVIGLWLKPSLSSPGMPQILRSGLCHMFSQVATYMYLSSKQWWHLLLSGMSYVFSGSQIHVFIFQTVVAPGWPFGVRFANTFVGLILKKFKWERKIAGIR